MFTNYYFSQNKLYGIRIFLVCTIQINLILKKISFNVHAFENVFNYYPYLILILRVTICFKLRYIINVIHRYINVYNVLLWILKRILNLVFCLWINWWRTHFSMPTWLRPKDYSHGLIIILIVSLILYFSISTEITQQKHIVFLTIITT